MFIKEHFKGWLISVFLIINFFIWYGVFSENREFLTVAFLDVGQGDAIFIESPDGKQVLIDGGPNSQVLRQLAKVMPFYDRSIDLVVMTHPDADHVGGLPSVLENYKVDYIMEPGVSSNSGIYKEFEKIIKEKKIKKIFAKQGLNIFLCNFTENQFFQNYSKSNSSQKFDECNTYLEVLFPVKNIKISELKPNTASIVLKLIHDENSFLFTGDSPKSIEKYLVQSLGDYIDVDVLKLGHHGSKTSTSDLFLGFTSPEYAVVSAGKNNRYGHPHQEVLDLLKKFRINLLRTDESGIIIFKGNGQNLILNI